MSVQVFSENRPTARKHHRCNDCGGWIVPGEIYNLQRNLYDGGFYDWKQHMDCRAMSIENWHGAAPYDYEDGIPPLCEDESVMEELDQWRGHYPHVVCRIEFRQQIAAIKRAEYNRECRP